MGFFDKLKETAADVAVSAKAAAANAGDKAKDLAETGKQKMAIAEAEKNIKAVYTQIGQEIIENFPEIAAEKFPELSGKIAEFKAAIETAQAAIAALANKGEVKAEEAVEAVEAAEAVVEEVKEAE